METALSTLIYLPETREQQRAFVNKAVEEIANGDNDPARVYAKLRILGDTIKDILDNQIVKDAAINEVRKYKGDCNLFGNKVTIGTRKNWNYDNCNDSLLNTSLKNMEALKLTIAERQKFLQALKPGMIAVDELTGEQLVPASYSETEFITVK